MSLFLAAQIVGCVESLISMWLIGKQKVSGQWLSALGVIPWGAVAVLSHGWVMLAFDAMLTLLSIRAALLWMRMNKERASCCNA